MHAIYDTAAPKKPTNLTINQDLLKRARSLKLNLSKVLEEQLVEILRQQERQAWVEENKDAIQQYNDRIEKNGAFGDSIRRF